MFSGEFGNEMDRYVEKLKKFLTSKDLLVFLLFLLLSFGLWALKMANKTYETVVEVPLQYVEKPKGYIVTEELPSRLRVTVSGQGLSLLRCRWNPRPLDLNLTSIHKKNKNYLLSNSLTHVLKRKLGSEIQVLRVSPDTLKFSMEKLAEKKVPVKVRGFFELAQQYTFCDTMSYEPKEVVIYGAQEQLDTISEIFTEEVNVLDIKDTMQSEVPLHVLPMLSCSDSIVRLQFKTERFTEKTFLMPVSIVNMPEDKVLKMFPSNVSVCFNVGLSHYDKIDVSSFTLFVDYQKTLEGAKKLEVRYENDTLPIFGVKLSPSEVDYIIEVKQPKKFEK